MVWSDNRGKNGNLAALVSEDACKFFNKRGLARAAYGEVTHGDNLYAKVIADDAGFVQPAAA